MMFFKSIAAAMILTVGLFFTPAAHAELAFVSGVDGPVAADGDPGDVAIFHPDFVWDPEIEPEGDFRGAGFPFWYQDNQGLRLTLCLDGEEEGFPCAWEGSPVFTSLAGCEGDEEGEHFDFLYPYQEVVGFGDEAFYFKLQSSPFDVPMSIGGSFRGFAQLQLLLETTWGEDDRIEISEGVLRPLEGPGGILDQLGVPALWIEGEDHVCRQVTQESINEDGLDLHRVEPGYEILFTRVRLRVLPGLDDPLAPAGWYRFTHPYGVKTVYHPTNRDDGNHRIGDRTEVRQVVGDLPAGGGPDDPHDFTIALNDPETLIAELGPDADPFIGLRLTGFTNDEEFGYKATGPYLFKPDYLDTTAGDNALLRIVENGTIHQYIGFPPAHDPIEPDDPDAHLFQGHPIIGSNFFDEQLGRYANFFRVQYQPGDRNVMPSRESWTAETEVAFTDQFNVVGKVADNCGDASVDHPIANGLADAVGTAPSTALTFDPFLNDEDGGLPIFKLMTEFIEDGITMELQDRLFTFANGTKISVNPDGTATYVTAEDFIGTHEFDYIVRDACGRESQLATITIIVEDLQIEQAQLRLRTGKWQIGGTSSYTIENEVRNEISLYAGPFSAEKPESNVLIGTATVNDDNSWTFSGKSSASPAAGTVTAVSSLGVATETVELVLR
jgi:hypothetical protein